MMTTNDKALRLLNHIGNELKFLWLLMDGYQEIFLVEEERRGALLRATAPGFFTTIQASLAESILMRVFRLMDPRKSCRNENASIQGLSDALPADHLLLKKDVENLSKDWKGSQYSRLQTIRNKMLGHNDLVHRDEMEFNQLWFNITFEDFALMQQLAGRLWDLYRQFNRVLLDKDVVEPIHASRDDRPARLLEHLCGSRYLDSLIDGDVQHLAKLRARKGQEMGEDRIRPVFRAPD